MKQFFFHMNLKIFYTTTDLSHNSPPLLIQLKISSVLFGLVKIDINMYIS